MPDDQQSRVLLIATTNPGKAREMAAVLADLPGAWRFLSLRELANAPPEPVEDGRTFRENAEAKALYYARQTGLLSLADDSGLEVDALGGRPGVHSARYAGPQHSDEANNEKLRRELTGVPDEQRTARFRCVMALAQPDGRTWTTEGVIEGRIGHELRGTNGFGFDPLFVLPSGQTQAEIAPEQKNEISHRGQATRKMKAILVELVGQTRCRI
jgi:XTP/dITP diphosphohydrolase